MFRSKITLSLVVITFFLMITSIIKNKTRSFEKQIYHLNKKISLKEKDLNDSQFDYFYLSSPFVIEGKIENLNYHNYLPMEHSKIFLNLKNFTNIQSKITIFKNPNEKKIKKN